MFVCAYYSKILIVCAYYSKIILNATWANYAGILCSPLAPCRWLVQPHPLNTSLGAPSTAANFLRLYEHYYSYCYIHSYSSSASETGGKCKVVNAHSTYGRWDHAHRFPIKSDESHNSWIRNVLIENYTVKVNDSTCKIWGCFEVDWFTVRNRGR